MPEYEGFIASLKGNGKADVIIQPQNAGIPMAPELNDKVCHCATDGSTLQVEALNPVGADVGDQVCVTLKSDAVLRNAAMLLGIPAGGIVLGVVVAFLLTNGFSAHAGLGILIIGAGLLLGIIVGIFCYKRLSSADEPVVERIIRTRLEMASSFDRNKVLSQTTSSQCHGCSNPC